MKTQENVEERKKRTYYGKTASEYDKKRFTSWFGKKVNELEKKAIQRLLDKIKVKKVLDMPCGTGRITQYLLENGYTVSGSDVSSDMVKEAKKKLKGYKKLNCLVVAPGDHLPFKDNEYELVTCIRLMNHLPKESRAKILKELHRVTKYLLVSNSKRSSIFGIKKYVKIKLGLLDKNWFPAEEWNFAKELKTAGFKITHRTRSLNGVGETYFMLARKE